MKNRIISLFLFLSIGLSSWMFAQGTQTSLDSGMVAFFPFSGNAGDSSTSMIDGIVHNAVLDTGLNGQPNQSYFFNGNAWIDCGLDDRGITDQISICAWVKTENSSYQWVVGKYGGNAVSSDHGYALLMGNSVQGYDGLVSMDGRDGNQVYKRSGYDLTAMNDGKWHFLTGIVDGQHWKIYVDGQLKSDSMYSNLMADLRSPAIPLSIGNRLPQQTQSFQGNIDQVRIYNRPLCQAEISALFQQQDTTCRHKDTLSTSIVDWSESHQFRMYLNSSNDHIFMEANWEIGEYYICRIVDLQGREIQQYAWTGRTGRERFPLRTNSSGIYILELRNRSGQLLVSNKFWKK